MQTQRRDSPSAPNSTRRMLYLIPIFCLFLWLLAKAPRDVVQLLLAGAWTLLAVGCTASVVQALVR